MERINLGHIAGPSSTSATKSLPVSKQRMALIVRCTKQLFSAYRADQFADAEGFVKSIGEVLRDFPDEVIEHVTSPRTGIQRRLKWPPSISEVVEACEQHQDYLARLRQPRRDPVPRVLPQLLRDRPDGSLAQAFVPEGHARYESLCKWAEKADRIWWRYGKSSDGRSGIWVSLRAFEGDLST